MSIVNTTYTGELGVSIVNFVEYLGALCIKKNTSCFACSINHDFV